MMKLRIKRRLFNAWYKFAPTAAARWLNRKLERAENSAAARLQRNCRAADELEIQCEEAELPIRHPSVWELLLCQPHSTDRAI